MFGYHWKGPKQLLGEHYFAVVGRDRGKLYPALWIRRSAEGEIFAFIPRESPAELLTRNKWNPHASYHKDGRLHQKSFHMKTNLQQCQKPDANFKGVVNMMVTDFSAKDLRSVNITCSRESFADVIDIPMADMEDEPRLASIDIVETGGPGLPHPYELMQERRYAGFLPEILLSIWRSDDVKLP